MSIPLRMNNRASIQDMKKSLAETLEELIKSRPELLKASGEINVTRAAKAIGLNQPTLARIMAGMSKTPSPENEAKICKYFGISVEELRGGYSIQRDINPFTGDAVAEKAVSYGVFRESLLGIKRVPELDVNARLGPGNEFQNGDVVRFWDMEQRELLLSRVENPVIITVTGKSMEPTLSDGDKVLIDYKAPKNLDGSVYVLDSPSGTQVKRVNVIGDVVRVISDNKDKDTFPNVDCEPEAFDQEFQVRGVVVQRMRWERIN